MRKYFKLNTIVGVTDRVLSWQSKGLSNESIKPPTASNKSCLKQSNFTFTHKK